MRLERYNAYGYTAKSLGVKSIPCLFSQNSSSKFSFRVHSLSSQGFFQHYESWPEGMQLPCLYQLDSSVCYDLRIWCLSSNNILLPSSEGQQRAMVITCNVYGICGIQLTSNTKELTIPGTGRYFWQPLVSRRGNVPH